MYLLQEQSTDEQSFEKQLRSFAEQAADLRAQSEAMLRELDSQRDFAYGPDNPLSRRTELILGDLRGEGTSYYLDNLYGKELTENQKHDVARAMVLADETFGLKDRIARDLTERAIRRSIVDSGYGGYSLGFEYAGRKRGSYGWSAYMDRVSGKILDEISHTDRAEYCERLLQIDCGEGVTMKLTLRESFTGELSWRARGSSKARPRHRKLVAELNRIAEDQQERLALAKRYREAKLYPGLTANEELELKQLLEKVNYNQSLPTELPNTRPGAYFGDEPAIQGRRTTRIYMLRCEDCLQPAAFDVVYPVSGASSRDWKSTDQHVIGHRIVEETYFNLELERFHRAKGCSSILAYNSRIGSVQDLRQLSGKAVS